MAEITQKLVDGAGLQTAMGIMGNYSDNMDRGVVGGYNQSFPLTAATKGNIYYHKPTNRYYICINNYSGSSLTNPNSNFEELSVYTNRQRLDNLSNIAIRNLPFASGNLKHNERAEKIIQTDFKRILAVYISRTLAYVGIGCSVYEYANVKEIRGGTVILEFENASNITVGIEGSLLVTGLI